MSSLSDDLLQPQREVKRVPCKLGTILAQLPEDESAALNQAVSQLRSSTAQGRNRVHSSVWLSKVLKKHGYPVAVSTIQRHVNKECACEQLGE